MHGAALPSSGTTTSGTTASGSFPRQPAAFSDRITRDGSSGYTAQPGRYQLYASLADPWSHRALIVRRLLGLERVIGVTVTDPIPGARGWRFPDHASDRAGERPAEATARTPAGTAAAATRSPGRSGWPSCTWPPTPATPAAAPSRCCGTPTATAS